MKTLGQRALEEVLGIHRMVEGLLGEIRKGGITETEDIYYPIEKIDDKIILLEGLLNKLFRVGEI